MVEYVSKNRRAKVALSAAAVLLGVVAVVLSYGTGVFAAGADFSGVVKPIVDLLNSFVNPLLLLVGAGGAIFCIILGVKYATAEEPQEREKRKQALKTAIIGFVLIFVLFVALKLSIKPLTKWMNDNLKGVSDDIQITTEVTNP